MAQNTDNPAFWAWKVVTSLVSDLVAIGRAIAMLLIKAVKEAAKAVWNWFAGWISPSGKRRVKESEHSGWRVGLAIERNLTKSPRFGRYGDSFGNETHIFLTEENSLAGPNMLELLVFAGIDLEGEIIQRDGQLAHIEKEFGQIWPALWKDGRFLPEDWWASPSFQAVQAATWGQAEVAEF